MTSISSTPTVNSDSSAKRRMDLLATAKRDAAKKILYSRFFRGPVLGPDDEEHISRDTTQIKDFVYTSHGVEVFGKISIDSKAVVKDDRATKRKRNQGGRNDECLGQQKKRRKCI